MQSNSSSTKDAPVRPVRSISLVLLVLYGLGTTIGAGIYVIIGAAGAGAGYYLPMVFLLAGAIAALSAASFAELAVRYPVAAGEAEYIRAGLGLRGMSTVVGLGIALSATVASATLLQGGVGYLKQLWDVPDAILLIGLLVLLGGVVIWGVTQSVCLAAALALAEIGGLLLLVFYAPDDPVSLASKAWQLAAPLSWNTAFSMTSSMLLVFFAFIGFEDMVNVVEEVRAPSRNMPLAIGLTLAVTLVLYVWISLIVITTLSPLELESISAPLSATFAALGGPNPALFSALAVIAVVNGVIIQLIMVSRLLYGLANNGQVPKVLGRLWPVTRTPVVAVVAMCLCIALLGLSLPLTALAGTTSAFTLVAFAMVNLALYRLKLDRALAKPSFCLPRWCPLLGLVSCVGLVLAEIVRRFIAWW